MYDVRKPSGWKDLKRSCPACGCYIPKYIRKCPDCGQHVGSYNGAVFKK